MQKISLILLGALLTCLCGSGCSYFMLWQIAEYEHDDTRADQAMRQLEEERALRMQANPGYTDQQINAVNARSSIGSRSAGHSSRPLSVDELREQQERERAKRKR